MLDLRGLISLDNKTKRVNVLIVADGAGILGKCVKLVLTSGSHSSPPCCDLLLTSLCCSLHPSHSIPRSSHIHFSIPLVTLSLVSLLYIHTQQVRETGLNGMQEKDRAPRVVQALHPHMDPHENWFWTAVKQNQNIYLYVRLIFHNSSHVHISSLSDNCQMLKA